MKDVYAVVILPPFEISGTIEIFRHGLESVIGKYPGYKSEAAILLFAAMCDLPKIKVIEKKIEMVCHNQFPINIQLCDFGELYNKKTIHIPLSGKSAEDISGLRKKLSHEIKTEKFDEDVDFTIGRTPHIPIARNLSDEQYRIAKNYFRGRKYDASFECTELTLRKLINKYGFQEYETIRSFSFAPKNLSLF